MSKTTLSPLRLPEEIIWFEPPTVCRWESIAETEASERIENKSNTDQLSTRRSVRMVSRKTERTEVTITDFDLLRIPPKVDINFIIQDIIVPRLPDGYTIALSEPKSRPNSSTLFMDDTQIARNNRITIEPTKDFLIATDSPRPLHPKRKLKFDVKIVERKPTLNEIGESSVNEHEYLLSQLLQDLDELCDKQHPQILKQMENISDILSESMPDEQGSDQAEGDSSVDDLAFRVEEFPWNKKVETVPEIIEPIEEDSDEEFEESEDEEYISFELFCTVMKLKHIMGFYYFSFNFFFSLIFPNNFQ